MYHRFSCTSLIALLLLAGCEIKRHGQATLPEVVDYNLHIRPVLSDRCFTCHGPDENKREAGLRLDLREAAVAELKESPGAFAIRPGKPKKSAVVQRIHHADLDEVMPPAESNLSLSDYEKQLIERWIKQGAEYKPLWSLIPARSEKPPRAPKHARINNEIDRFVAKQLSAKQLAASPPASKEILIRRAAFDLTGLPPTLEEIDAFLDDDSPDAYEHIIDRYLAVPAYGERMAAFWMDIARYADSDGYLDDKHRDFSPWRDWVIEAFNENLPYDQFVTWQLAGDLLPDATQDQVLATAFNRLHKKNSEAGIVFEEFRSEYVADRTNTFGKAFLGLTMECARCHDHKYDPISQKEYFQLYAFFNSTNEIGHAVYGPDQTPGPALLLSSEDEEAAMDHLKEEVSRLENEREAVRKTVKSDVDSWRFTPSSMREIAETIQASKVARYSFDTLYADEDKRATSPEASSSWAPATLVDPVSTVGVLGKAIQITDYNKIALGERVGWYDRTDPFTIDFWIHPDTVYSDAMLFTHSEEWRLGLRGYTLHLEENQLVFRMAHSYPQNAIRVRGQQRIPARAWTQVTVTYDGSSKGKGVTLYQNGEKVPADIEVDHLYKGILFTPDIHTYGFRGIEFGHRDKFTPFKGGKIDEFSVYDRALSALEVQYINNPTPAFLDTWATRYAIEDEASQALLLEYYLANHHAEYQQLSSQIKQVLDSLNTVLNGIEEIMVMGDMASPRPTYILERGLYDAEGEEVYPDAPASIMAFPEGAPANRLGLAEWLFHSENPLTARVMVNRIWKMHFGEALVSTVDDFGNQGAMPTHPELLDWLAEGFKSSGWDVKALHKRIMLSATYQQSSAITQELNELDPENTWLARGASFRLPAEMIRDNALAISGLLSDTIGGPGVYPYQPEGLWDELSTKSWRYPYLQEPGEGLYRRSLYTIWKRTSPPPSMLIFDAPDRSTCEVDRQATSTPLQALVLLNDSQFVEAARATAERTIMEVGTDRLNMLTSLFRRVTGRTPSRAELILLDEFYEHEYQTFADEPGSAQAFLSNGESSWNKEVDARMLAALAVVSNALMNTDEGYTRR